MWMTCRPSELEHARTYTGIFHLSGGFIDDSVSGILITRGKRRVAA